MTVRVKKSEPPESTEILAEAIVRIGDAVTILNKNGLNRRAIVVLIQDATKIGRSQINEVLDALPRLRGWYCKADLGGGE